MKQKKRGLSPIFRFNSLRISLICFLVISITGCGANLVGKTYFLAKREAAKSRSAYKQFQELCSSSNRSKIYKKAIVKGYISVRTSGLRCKGGWDAVADQGYKYYECSSTKVEDRNSIEFNSVYRLEIASGDDPKCITWDNLAKEIASHDEAIKYQEKLNGKCFIKNVFNYSDSQYVKLFEYGYVDNMGNHILKFPNDKTKINLISFSGISVFNINTNEILSTDRDYQYWPESINNQEIGNYTCEEDKKINELKVLIPEL